MKNYQSQSLCYQQKPKAEVGNTNGGLDSNSSYHAKTEFNNYCLLFL
jgi:hypothetical protein